MRSQAIRTQLEQSLRRGDLSPTPPSAVLQTVPTGIQALDRLTGGLPRGRITEISGSPSSGRTSLMLSALAQITGGDEVCGVIDPAGTFDPVSAARLGTDLERVLWVRTGRRIDSTLKTADLLLQGGGFGFIGVDLSELSPVEVQRVPLSSWFRLQRAIEHTPTILMFLSGVSMIQAAAWLAVRLELRNSAWSPRLFHGLQPSAEIMRSKVQPAGWGNWPGAHGCFELRSPDCAAAVHDPREEARP